MGGAAGGATSCSVRHRGNWELGGGGFVRLLQVGVGAWIFVGTVCDSAINDVS